MKYRYFTIFLLFIFSCQITTAYPKETDRVKTGNIMLLKISTGYLEQKKEPDLKSGGIGQLHTSDKVEILERSEKRVDETEKMRVTQIAPHIISVSETGEFDRTKNASSLCYERSKIQAYFSPSGEFLAIQRINKFHLFRTENFFQEIKNQDYKNLRPGVVVGFLPSNTLVYSTEEGTYLLDPHCQSPQKIFKERIDCFFMPDFIVIASNDLMISSSSPFSDVFPQTIIRYDIKKKQITKGAEIGTFMHPRLSPSGKYFIYWSGDEEWSSARIYSIQNDKVETLAGIDPNKTSTSFLGWLSEQDRALIKIWKDESTVWLALYDVPNKKIEWKKTIEHPHLHNIFPTEVLVLDSKKALVSDYNNNGIYELNLKSGRFLFNKYLSGCPISVNFKTKMIACLEIGSPRHIQWVEGPTKLYVSSLNGHNKRLLLNLSALRHQAAYMSMGARPPLWSPRGDFIILFGDHDLYFVQVNL